MIQIFAENKSSRLLYVLDYVFNYRFETGYQLITSMDNLKNNEWPLLNYSNRSEVGGIQIIPEGLLSETGTEALLPVRKMIGETPVLFPNGSQTGFDLFSAIFWMLSRYEEYQDFQRDYHGRFQAIESFAYQNDFLDVPVVDEWIVLLKKNILRYHPHQYFRKDSFRIEPTIDVDSPWAFRNKGVGRNIGGLLKDLLSNRNEHVKRRLDVFLHGANDPFYRFTDLEETMLNMGLEAKYFIHVGKYGMHDKTIASYKTEFKDFVKKLSEENFVGLHPSYAAADNERLFQREKDRLEKITGQKIDSSRQHYLKIDIPVYYPALERTGIKHDYSMGFADKPGFRAGTNRPFRFYNIKSEEVTDLWIHPFVLMDRTLRTYQNLSKEAAAEIYKQLINKIFQTNGYFSTVWHNESLSGAFEWKNWEGIYKEMLEYAVKLGDNKF